MRPAGPPPTRGSAAPAAGGRAPTLGRCLVAWLVLLAVAMANGVARDFAYGRHLDERTAHQFSTAVGIVLFGFVIRAFVRRYPPPSGSVAWRIGVGWLALTIAFEFLFFHYVAGHPWAALLANYDVLSGRVWVFLLAWVAVAPYLFHRMSRTSAAMT